MLATILNSVSKVLEFMERIEICLMESWPNPKKNHEDSILEVLEDLVLTNKYQPEEDFWGWRFTLFQQLEALPWSGF